MAHRTAPEGSTVLLCTPFGRDADSIEQMLRRQGYIVRSFPDLEAIAEAFDGLAGIVLLAEEALRGDLSPLRRAASGQPPWSDVPFVLFAASQAGRPGAADALRERLLEFTGNVVVLERPLAIASLLSVTSAAMRARQRQFEMRDRLAELDAQYARLNVLLDNLPVGVAFIRPDFTSEVTNPAFRRFRPDGGIPSQDADGELRWIGVDGDGVPIARDRFPIARALAGEQVRGTEYRYLQPGAGPVWTRVSATPLRDGGEAVTGAIAVVVDIDEEKRAQAALVEAADRLEQLVAERTIDLQTALARLREETADRERIEATLRQSQKMEAVGQLTGGIAHDFNNMLTGVIGAIDVMRRRIATGRLDDLARFMDAATASAQRAAGLTARLLAFSRRQSLDARAIDVSALVGSLEELLRRTLGENVALSSKTSPDLPPVIADANQLENAILNLAINARDAMPDGGRLTVETSAVHMGAQEAVRLDVSPGEYVVIAVSDSGVGMSPDVVEKVFDPFFTTKPIGQGTGLGLSMVYGFVRQSGGQVRVHSTPGLGTTVSIFLAASAQDVSPVPQHPPPVTPEGQGQTVLLVEDDPSVRLLVREVLEELSYTALEAEEANAAIRVLTSGQPIDLMVSDVGLPGLNGRQLAEIAREHRPSLPILFITGYAENAAIRAGFLGTNMAMITKPFALEALASKISEMMR